MEHSFLHYTKAFGKFWYNFIIGDDWTLAATIIVGIVADMFLRHSHLPAWYIMPILVTLILGISIVRKH